jgi:protein gp37
MSERTNISWATSTFNPWIGCTKVSPGCDHCYAERDMALRRHVVQWGPGAPRKRTSEAYWKQPHAWNRKAMASGQPWRVFCASLADIFDNEVPEAWREDLFALIAETPYLTWMLLTKRIGRWTECVPAHWMVRDFPVNVWMGITVVNQAELDRDWWKLAEVPAAVRFLSCEPLLGPLTLGAYYPDWIIVGGESGPRARAMAAEWPRAIRDECAYRGTPFHFKQWGGRRPAHGGHFLDGIAHHAFPDDALNASFHAEKP